MGLKETSNRLEEQTTRVSGTELCLHLSPIIAHVVGSAVKESSHDRGCPPLRVVVGYTDSSAKRTRQAAHDAFANIRELYCFEPDRCAEIVANEYPVTAAELLERTT